MTLLPVALDVNALAVSKDTVTPAPPLTLTAVQEVKAGASVMVSVSGTLARIHHSAAARLMAEHRSAERPA